MCYIYGDCVCALFDLSFICVLISKVRELLIFVLCVMMFIDLFIDLRESF